MTPAPATGPLVAPAAPGLDWWRPAGADGRAADPARPAVPRDDALPFAALLTFTCVLFLAPQSWIPALAAWRPALLAAATGIAAHVLARWGARRPITMVSREIVLVACLAGWAVLTLPFSRWPGGTLAFLAGDYCKTVAVFWLIANVVTTPGRMRSLTRVLVLLSLPLAATAILHFTSGVLAPGGAQPGAPRIAGYDAPLTANPNDLALTLNLIVPFVVARLIGARRAAGRLAYAGILGLDVVGVVLTFSRTGFLCLAVLAAFYVVKTRGRQRLGVAAALLVSTCFLPFLPPSYAERMRTILDISADTTGSAQARSRDMVVAAELVLEHPLLGAGAGMNALALNEKRGPAWKRVHNVYLEYAVDLGVPGLLLFGGLLASCLARTRAVERRRPASGEVGRCAVAIQASLTVFAVAAMFHPVGYQFYFYYIAGLATALAQTARGGARAAG